MSKWPGRVLDPGRVCCLDTSSSIRKLICSGQSVLDQVVEQTSCSPFTVAHTATSQGVTKMPPTSAGVLIPQRSPRVSPSNGFRSPRSAKVGEDGPNNTGCSATLRGRTMEMRWPPSPAPSRSPESPVGSPSLQFRSCGSGVARSDKSLPTWSEASARCGTSEDSLIGMGVKPELSRTRLTDLPLHRSGQDCDLRFGHFIFSPGRNSPTHEHTLGARVAVEPSAESDVRNILRLVEVQTDKQETQIRILQSQVKSLSDLVSHQCDSQRSEKCCDSLSCTAASGAGQDVALLRQEVARMISNECEARLKESAELRMTLESLSDQLAKANAAVKAAMQPDKINNLLSRCSEATRFGPNAQQPELLAQSRAVSHRLEELASRVEGVLQEIGIEREKRCATSAELHAHLAREIVEVRVACNKAIEEENVSRSIEARELRAILDSIWKRVDRDSEPSSIFPKVRRSTVGDFEDVNTLYEMVKEALGDTVRLSQEINEEREVRCQEYDDVRHKLEWFERLLGHGRPR
uniref:Uncharacterized protein n=1 Tax=Noctiluca scintillans TaxID=2966 RepID=A0A7S1AN49_NOCSC|mmetsp:Transcript_53174/g.142187  ORF Transcript_53174/g.142187 Transcript_53174/m.142187 type:complete len:521 (+) Transcript_53174:57-1619(+)